MYVVNAHIMCRHAYLRVRRSEQDIHSALLPWKLLSRLSPLSVDWQAKELSGSAHILSKAGFTGTSGHACLAFTRVLGIQKQVLIDNTVHAFNPEKLERQQDGGRPTPHPLSPPMLHSFQWADHTHPASRVPLGFSRRDSLHHLQGQSEPPLHRWKALLILVPAETRADHQGPHLPCFSQD